MLRRSLEPRLPGRWVRRIEVWNPALREPVDRRRLRQAVGRRIEGLRRRAKYLLIDLEGGRTLVVHLGMSGRLTLAGSRTRRQPHEHVGVYLSGGQRLRFRDPRRFGLVLLLATSRLAGDRHFAGLGPEPLDGDDPGLSGPAGGFPGVVGFSGDWLRSRAAGRRGPVKNLLLDGRVVAGVGNIYASEALWRAGIHPGRSVARIAAARWDRLAEAVGDTLLRAIGEGGTTLNDFTDGAGRSGLFQISLAVYDREGEPCARCAAPIRRLVQAGRSTFYCPGCQR